MYPLNLVIERKELEDEGRMLDQNYGKKSLVWSVFLKLASYGLDFGVNKVLLYWTLGKRRVDKQLQIRQ